MNIVVVGLGSMGTRRIRLLRDRIPETAVSGADPSAERRRRAEETYGITCFSSFCEAVQSKKFDAAFICTSPDTHCDLIREALQADLHVFTELNLIDGGYGALIDLARERGKRIFLSSTLLYRREVQEIMRLIEGKGPLMYIYHVGQYLPDWHPWENYRDFFVGRRETNGCREILAIQLPWIWKAFGAPGPGMHVSAKKISGLDIDYADSYIVTLEHEGGNRGVLVVDVVSRKASCRLEIVGEKLHVLWDGTPDGLQSYSFEKKAFEGIPLYDSFEQDPRYAVNIIEDAYAAEIDTFLCYVAGLKTPLYTIEEDERVLKLIGTIEGESR
ncbi:MAG: Gfo/Idh/MocA family protein [Christensenellales bacterium]|jgi:predicted dehydrogenase